MCCPILGICLDGQHPTVGHWGVYRPCQGLGGKGQALTPCGAQGTDPLHREPADSHSVFIRTVSCADEETDVQVAAEVSGQAFDF